MFNAIALLCQVWHFYCHAECPIFISVLSVIMLSGVVPSVVMLIAIMPNVVMPSAGKANRKGS